MSESDRTLASHERVRVRERERERENPPYRVTLDTYLLGFLQVGGKQAKPRLTSTSREERRSCVAGEVQRTFDTCRYLPDQIPCSFKRPVARISSKPRSFSISFGMHCCLCSPCGTTAPWVGCRDSTMGAAHFNLFTCEVKFGDL